jgi:predicted secreted protein with PEFG-CTERM motif
MKTLYLVILFISFCILIAFSSQSSSAQIGRVYFGSLPPQITTSGNNLDIIWQYWNPEREVYLVTSNDSGTTLSSKINVSKNSTIFFTFGNMVASGNNIYYTWWNNTFPYTPRLFLIKSTDYGLTFGKPVLIVSHDQYFNEDTELDKLIALGKNVYAIWSTYREIDGRSFGTIFLSKSTDGGLSFDKPIEINKPDTNWSGLETATSGKKTYFLWESIVNQTCIQGWCNSQINIRSIDNNGNLSIISNPLILDKAFQVKITASDNNVYLTGVMFQPNYSNSTTNGLQTIAPQISPQWVFFTKSADGGATFGKLVNLSGSLFYCVPSGTNYQCNLGSVHSYVSGTGIYIIWDASNYTANDHEAFFVSSVNDGDTFGKVIKLNPFQADNIDCEYVEQCISIQTPTTSNGTVYLSWSANTMNPYYDHGIFAKSTDGGNTFDYTDISNSTGITTTPVIAAGPNNTIYLSGIRSGFPEGSHAFFSKSIDGGNSFSKGIDLDLLPEVSVPEFPLAIPILFVSIMSIIVFYRIKITK